MTEIERNRVIRILCPEPENYSQRGLAKAAEFRRLDAATLSQAEFEVRAPHYDAFMVRLRARVSGELIGACPRLRAIITPTTGLDHIDLETAHARRIAIFCLRGETEFLRTVTSTAEHTWALLLCLVRHLISARKTVEQDEWHQHRFRSCELSGKTLGVLGLGRVGTMVARYGLAFGMRVIAYDPYIETWPDGVTLVATLEEMLRGSKLLTVHVPLQRETVDLIGAREIGLLPSRAYLVNTSRGQIVNESALLAALESGHLAGAAVDVLTDEMNVPGGNHQMVAYLKTHDNLLITPHIGGASEEAIEKADLFVLGKFDQWLRSI